VSVVCHTIALSFDFFVNSGASVLVYQGMSTDVSVNTPSDSVTPNTPPLPNDIPTLHAMIAELIESLNRSERDREGLQQRIDQLLRRLYGPKAERFDPNQPWLIPEMAQADAAARAAPTTADAGTGAASGTAKPKAPGHGRKQLPADLPRRRVEYVLTEAQRLCPDCGAVCPKFAEEISEQLDCQPASLFVWQHVRFKYACVNCHEHIAVAPAPVQVINKGLPGPGLLAQITASKYADHLPLHRLERILRRHGVELSRSTMCHWMAVVADLLGPVVDLMADLVRQSRMIHTDATKMPYLDPEAAPGRSLSGQMWTYYGDREHPFNVFGFCADHSAAGIDAFLKDKNYRGYLNADALNVYDHLFRNEDIIEVGCWAHCRRNFYEAKESDPARAHLVLAWIGQCYQVEKEAKRIILQGELAAPEADALCRQMRQERSLAVLTELRQWLLDQTPELLPKSPMGQAAAYALRHWQALTRYLDHGFLAIDNNVAERTLRHIAIGRKNWLFAGSSSGAQTAAILFSVTSSCDRHGVDAFAYVHDLLGRLAHDPRPAPEVLRGWLPDRWRPPPSLPAGL
jgi:transposase